MPPIGRQSRCTSLEAVLSLCTGATLLLIPRVLVHSGMNCQTLQKNKGADKNQFTRVAADNIYMHIHNFKCQHVMPNCQSRSCWRPQHCKPYYSDRSVPVPRERWYIAKDILHKIHINRRAECQSEGLKLELCLQSNINYTAACQNTRKLKQQGCVSSPRGRPYQDIEHILFSKYLIQDEVMHI